MTRRDGGDVPLGLLEYLDLSPSGDASTKRRAAWAGALLADRLGYRRIWVPEHHGVGSPSTNPLLTAAVLGSHTARARVGTAVTLLRIRDPRLTAEDIATAASYSPDRFDVGLGRGGVLGPASESLRHLQKDDARLEADLRTLVAELRAGSELVAPIGASCELWLHGAGGRSAVLAADLGAHYCHGLFLNPDLDTCLAAIDTYRSRAPAGVTAVALAVAANQAPARAAADAGRQPFSVVAGTFEDCASTVLSAMRATGSDEVVIAEVSSDPEDHLRALREIFDLVSKSLAAQSEGVTSVG